MNAGALAAAQRFFATQANFLAWLRPRARFVDLGSISGTINLDFSKGVRFKATLIGNITFGTPLFALPEGMEAFFLFTQDGTGSRTFSYAAGSFQAPGGSITLSTTAAAVDAVSMIGGATKASIFLAGLALS